MHENWQQALNILKDYQIWTDWVSGYAGSATTPNTAALGIKLWSNCNRFGSRSAVKTVVPVRFAPGRLRLATRPNLTGSAPIEKTIGMVAVAALALTAAVPPAATIIATRRRTRSAASAGNRS